MGGWMDGWMGGWLSRSSHQTLGGWVGDKGYLSLVIKH